MQVEGDLYVWTYQPEGSEVYLSVPVLGDGSFDPETDYSYKFYANVVATEEGVPEKIAQSYRDLWQRVVDRLHEFQENGIPDTSTLTPDRLDEMLEQYTPYLSEEVFAQDVASVTSYTLSVTTVPNYTFYGLVGTGAAVLLGIVLAYAVLGIWIKPGKLVLGTVCILVVAAAAVAVIFLREIATMRSIREYVPGMYMCTVTNDYKLDEMLSYNIRTTDDLLDAGSRELMGGIPLSVDVPHFGCSSFSAVTEDGTHLFGRNYDYIDTVGMMIYTSPEDGYASIANCDLAWPNMAGPNQIISPSSLPGRFVLRGVAPHMCVDGMNDQGVGVSILMLTNAEVHQDTDKPDIIIPLAVRGILDTCASTDEAMEFLSSYDMNTMVGKNFHIFITDRSGHSVVAEWIDDELVFTQIAQVTNYYVAEGYDSSDCSRYSAMCECLSENGGVLSIEEALDLLNAACQSSDDPEGSQTEWSCVYDLDHFTMYIYNDNDRGNVYTVTAETFGG